MKICPAENKDVISGMKIAYSGKQRRGREDVSSPQSGRLSVVPIAYSRRSPQKCINRSGRIHL